MKQENIDYLQQHIHYWHTLRDVGYVTGFCGDIAKGLLRIVREEWDAQYSMVLHHPENVCILMRYAYEQYEKVIGSLAIKSMSGDGQNADNEKVNDAALAEPGSNEQEADKLSIDGQTTTPGAVKKRKKKRQSRAPGTGLTDAPPAEKTVEYALIRPPPGERANR